MAAITLDHSSYTPSYPITSSYVAQAALQRKRDGRRKERRREDARFAGNPYIVAPSKSDYAPIEPRTTPTFPAPPPVPRSAPAPSYVRPAYDPLSASAGVFRMSERGVRRAVARSGGPHMQALAAAVETGLMRWRDAEGAFDPAQHTVFGQTNTTPDTLGIVELVHGPHELRWAVPDPWTRYIVHCVARKCGIVSVSVDDSQVAGGRMTKLIRPHASRRNVRGLVGMHTPVTTDHEVSSVAALESDSEFTASEYGDMEVSESVEETPRPVRTTSVVQQLATVKDEGEDSGADWEYSDSDGELLSASISSLR